MSRSGIVCLSRLLGAALPPAASRRDGVAAFVYCCSRLAFCGCVASVLVWANASDGLLDDGLSTSLVGLEFLPRTTSVDPTATAPLRVSSSPAGATLRLDGSIKGRTPVDLLITPGAHSLALRHPDTIDDVRAINVGDEGTDLSVQLWSRRPRVMPNLPVFPGANLVDARFLDNGSVVLVVGLPINTTAIDAMPAREPWTLDPSGDDVSRVVIGGDRELRPPVLAVSPDGTQVAFVGPATRQTASTSTSSKTTQAVWVSTRENNQPPRLQYSSLDRDSRIADLSWDPQGQQLVVVNRLASEPPRSQIVLLHVGAPEANNGDTLITMPAMVVPGSESWDPKGRWVAFVSRSTLSGGTTVANLSAIEARPEGSFRYLADLGAPQRVPAGPAIAWEPTANGRAAFTAPLTDVAAKSSGPLDLFASLRPSTPPLALFATSIGSSADPMAHRLGTATGLSGPLWTSAGLGILGVSRPDDGSVLFRSVDPSTGVARNLDVHMPTGTGRGTALSVRWDEWHGRALVLARAATGDSAAASQSLKAWLVDFAGYDVVANP